MENRNQFRKERIKCPAQDRLKRLQSSLRKADAPVRCATAERPDDEHKSNFVSDFIGKFTSYSKNAKSADPNLEKKDSKQLKATKSEELKKINECNNTKHASTSKGLKAVAINHLQALKDKLTKPKSRHSGLHFKAKSGRESLRTGARRLQENPESFTDIVEQRHKEQHLIKRTPIKSVAKHSAAGNATNDAVSEELMEWEPLTLAETASSNTSSTELFPKNQEFGECIVGVSEAFLNVLHQNLQKFINKKTNETERVFNQQKLHVVPDTNIFLDHLHFLKLLLHVKLDNTEGCILFLPYKVIKELDNLNRKNQSPSLRTKAQLAIHFLNETFDKFPNFIISQTAVEEKII